jgi:hypothetical protein
MGQNEPRRDLFSRGWHRCGWLLLLALALAGGGMARGQALYDWDGVSMLHPDERFIVYTVWYAAVPERISVYFDGGCGIPPGLSDAVDPGVFSPDAAAKNAPPCRSLNPRDQEWSRIFVYGTLPTTLMRVASTALHGSAATPVQIRDIGRSGAWLAEMLTVVLVYLAARALLRREWAALASLLYALLPLPIQLSHFATVDAYASPLIVGALALLLRLRRLGWGGWMALGSLIGAAAAVRVTLLSLWFVVPLAWVAWQLLPSRRVWLPAVCAGVWSAVVWWLCDPTIWHDGWFDARWLHDVLLAGRLVQGLVDTPPSYQWSWQVPYLYPLQQLAWWGVGPLVGVALVGWLVQLRWRVQRLWPLWVWLGGYFAWQGGVFGMTMRYYLPLAAGMAIVAGWALVRLPRGWRVAAAGVVLGSTAVWALAWSGMYRLPHPRISASQWIYAAVPTGATLGVEIWDDVLPLTFTATERPSRYAIEQLAVFAPDRPNKYIGTDGENGFLAQLDAVDYLIVSSARASGVVVQMPRRFPVMTRYYAALADGSLGFTPVYRAARSPRIGSWWWDTSRAEEALSVYDHPTVIIYKKTAAYTSAAARRVLLEPSVWRSVEQIDTRTYRARYGGLHWLAAARTQAGAGWLVGWMAVSLLVSGWRARRIWSDPALRVGLAMHGGMVAALVVGVVVRDLSPWLIVSPYLAMSGWYAWRTRDGWWLLGGGVLLLVMG